MNLVKGAFKTLWAQRRKSKFSAQVVRPAKNELVKRLAGSSHELVVHDMHKSETATKAKNYGVRSVPAVVIDGKLASCCAGRGPEEHVLRSALA